MGCSVPWKKYSIPIRNHTCLLFSLLQLEIRIQEMIMVILYTSQGLQMEAAGLLALVQSPALSFICLAVLCHISHRTTFPQCHNSCLLFLVLIPFNHGNISHWSKCEQLKVFTLGSFFSLFIESLLLCQFLKCVICIIQFMYLWRYLGEHMDTQEKVCAQLLLFKMHHLFNKQEEGPLWVALILWSYLSQETKGI